jgi:hypothetical protein
MTVPPGRLAPNVQPQPRRQLDPRNLRRPRAQPRPCRRRSTLIGPKASGCQSLSSSSAEHPRRSPTYGPAVGCGCPGRCRRRWRHPQTRRQCPPRHLTGDRVVCVLATSYHGSDDVFNSYAGKTLTGASHLNRGLKMFEP